MKPKDHVVAGEIAFARFREAGIGPRVRAFHVEVRVVLSESVLVHWMVPPLLLTSSRTGLHRESRAPHRGWRARHVELRLVEMVGGNES